MKKYLYLLIISFSLTNCYTYRAKAEKDEAPQDMRQLNIKPDELAARASADPQLNLPAANSKGPKNSKTKGTSPNPNPKPANIEEKLEANKFYKIEVADRNYKIQVDKWESDTLVAHVIHKPKKILKFHKNQINQGTIVERRFSQPTADIITVVAYAAVGVGIWALVK